MKSTVAILALVAVFVAAPVSRLHADQASTDFHRQLLILDARHVSFDFKDKPLADFVSFLSSVTGVNFAVSPKVTATRSPADLNVTLKLRDVSARTAIDVVLQLEKLSLVYRSGVFFVTTPKDARGKPVLRIYAIGDLTIKIRDFPAPEIGLPPSGSDAGNYVAQKEDDGKEHAFADADFIMDLITQNAGEGTWQDAGVRYTANQYYLFIRQYPSVHREIQDVLDLLRAYR